MGNIKISIIIPVYNAEEYIKNTINSILKQPFKDYEVVIVNDGSIDNSLDICKEFNDKYSQIHLYTQENKGVTAARKKGVENATGEFILFLDADDLLAQNSLQELYSYCNGVDVVIGFNDDPIAIPKRKPHYITKDKIINDLLRNKIDAHPSAKLWRRILFMHDCLDAPPSIKLGEDLLMNLKLATQVNKGIIIYKQICIYICHEGQTTKEIKHNLEYEILFSKCLDEAIDSIKYQKGITKYKIYRLRNIIRFYDEDYNPKDPFVNAICRKALRYKLSLEDYVFIIFKNNQKVCRLLLQKIASIKRIIFHKYH